jgi:1,4-dihydroxy-2-naphthoate octaprenyltransferase
VLITGVIHADSLVGERQFWITRPYRWPQLVGAKVLFIAAFIYVPFSSGQWMLLRDAGMHPLAYLTGLLNLRLVTGIAVLPMACLAAVTSNFAKMLLGLLCLILFVAGVAYLSSLLPTSSTTNSFGDVLSFLGPVSVFVSVLIQRHGAVWAGGFPDGNNVSPHYERDGATPCLYASFSGWFQL